MYTVRASCCVVPPLPLRAAVHRGAQTPLRSGALVSLARARGLRVNIYARAQYMYYIRYMQYTSIQA
eukprot:COSAG02_NODE_3079_length_7411_cov_31.125957_1_plen_67_part_00